MTGTRVPRSAPRPLPEGWSLERKPYGPDRAPRNVWTDPAGKHFYSWPQVERRLQELVRQGGAQGDNTLTAPTADDANNAPAAADGALTPSPHRVVPMPSPPRLDDGPRPCGTPGCPLPDGHDGICPPLQVDGPRSRHAVSRLIDEQSEAMAATIGLHAAYNAEIREDECIYTADLAFDQRRLLTDEDMTCQILWMGTFALHLGPAIDAPSLMG